MGDKSLRKKQYIIEKAREVFMEKGYKRVTMKDIVEACDISRGGLYLYFDSTSQLFVEVLKAESEEGKDIFAGKITEDSTAADILVLFLQEQKKELLKKNDTLVQATYEFYFEEQPTKKDNVLRRQFEAAVKVIQRLIETGVENDEFICDDCQEAARNIMFVIEGLKISSQTIGLTSEMVDKQLLYILNTLGVESDQ